MGKKSREKKRREPAAAAVSPAAVAVQWSEPPRSPTAGADAEIGSWLDLWRQHGRTACILFGVALVVRVAFLLLMARTPYLEVDNIDSKGYQLWASQILAGDWLPHRHFYQSPFYAYYLALLYAICGTTTWVPRIIQILLGSASVALVYGLGVRLFSRRVGLIAAAMLCLYGPMITEELVLAKTALVVFGALLSFALFLRCLSTGDWRVMFGAGLVFGVTIIGVGQWLPVLFAFTVYAAVSPEAPRARRRPLAAAFLCGGLLCVVPVVAWNSYWGGGFMLTSGDAGLNLFDGNNPTATALAGRPQGLRDIPEFEEGDSRKLAERDVGHALTPAQVSQYWSRQALSWALQNPADFITESLKKIGILWNSFEIPDSYQYTFLRQEFIPWLWACLTFAVVGPLALVGIFLVAGHPPARPLYLICLGYLGVIALFYVRGRYRLPGVPFLILFAAAALDWLVAAAQQRHWQSLLACGIALLATAAFVNHAHCEPAQHKAPAICLSGDVWFDLEWMKLMEWYHERGDLDRATAYAYRAAQNSQPRGPQQTYLWIGNLELEKANGLLASKSATDARPHLEAAEKAYQRVLTYQYRLGETYTGLAAVYRRLGQPERAADAMESAVRARPKDAETLMRAVRLRVELGQCSDAERLRDQIARQRPEYEQAQHLLQSCAAH